MSKALLIIDVQEGMFSYGDGPFNGQAVVNNITDLIQRAREANVPIIYIQHTSHKVFPKGSKSWEIYHDIAPVDQDIVIEKTEWDAFLRTDLQDTLLEHDIKELIITGMQTDYCVDTTSRRAYSLGYSCTLVSDAHSTFDGEEITAKAIIGHHNEVLSGIAVVKPTKDIKF